MPKCNFISVAKQLWRAASECPDNFVNLFDFGVSFLIF